MNKDDKLKHLLFSHPNKFSGLKTFIELIEDQLKIAPTKRSKLYNIKQKVVLIEISDWWNANTARQQFFTNLLRAGIGYSLQSKLPISEKIQLALNSNIYFNETIVAVNLFLAGYNKLKDSKKYWFGWSEYLYENGDEDTGDVTVKSVKSLLKK